MFDENDMELVRRYANGKSEAAFGELVRRHLNLVYSAAMRYVRNPQDAEDIAQAVFVVLEKKAADLPSRTILTGWLYETARWTSMHFLRTQARRQRREQEAYMQSVLDQSHSEETWCRMKPLLEAAMSRLSQKDRTLLALRFFENKNGPETAAILGIGEWAVRKRVERALEKLHRYFSAHGVTSTTSAIGEAMAQHSVQAAPTALAGTIVAVALAKGVTASTSTLTLSKGALKLMAWTKMKTAGMIGIALALTLGGTTLAIKTLNPSVEDVFAHYQNSNYLRRAPAVTVLRPTQYGNEGSWINGIDNRLLGRNRSFAWVLAIAYDVGPEHMVLPPDLPSRGFDYLLTAAGDPRAALRQVLSNQFALMAHIENRTNAVLVMRISTPGKLKPSTIKDNSLLGDGKKFTFTHMTLSQIAANLGGYCLDVPIVDETGLTAFFDMAVPWDNRLSDNDRKEVLKQALQDQYGIELAGEPRAIEMLVVEHQNGPTDYTPRTGSDLQGYWKGTEQWGGHPWPVVLKITEPADGQFRAQFRNEWFNNDYAVATAVAYGQSKVKVEFDHPARVFEGELNDRHTTLTGTLKYTDPSFNGQSFPMTLTLTDPKANADAAAQKDFNHVSSNDLTGHWRAVVENTSLGLDVAKLPDGKLSCSLSLPGWIDSIEASMVQPDGPNMRMEWGYRRIGTFTGKVENGRLIGTYLNGRKGSPLPITFDRAE
ncbi:MAG TPA: TIGR03435 family protein [Desulfuromonadaceae bacterium]|nr:TIGR03435 family protein [Desulfuromonadaceae bacterium]